MTHDFTTVLRANRIGVRHPLWREPGWRIECSCGFVGVGQPKRDRLARSIAIHLACVAGDYRGNVIRYANAEDYMPEARAILAEIGAEK